MEWVEVEPEPAEAILDSAVYTGVDDLFGSQTGDTQTLTFSGDIAKTGTIKVEFEVAQYLDEGWGDPPMSWTIVDNQLIITATDEFQTPRDIIGDRVIGVVGLVDTLENDVIVPDKGVEVVEEE